MYRNAFYTAANNSITVAAWDENGKRITYEATVEPYLYLEGPGEDRSIFGTSLKKKTFASSYERYKFLKNSNIKRCFENFPIVQQYLIDSFWQLNETPEFTQHPIKVLFLDIEVYAPGDFPHADQANEPVNVITIYDTLTKKYHTWGTGAYDNKDPEVVYTHCTTEKQIFCEFFDYFEQDYPDIFTGWNSMGFDVPYVINRATKLFGEDFVKRLSPANNVYSRMVKGNFGNDVVRWFIEGVSVVDYLDLYKRFSLGQKESYKLAAIAEAEVGESKVDYGSGNLASLADSNWSKFVEYNIQDVKLLAKMEDKLKYTELLRMLAYTGLTTFEAAMGTITVITGSTAVRARYRNQKIPTFVRGDDTGKNPGAYVAEPLKGFQEKIVSFDASSLYPSVMISLNTSPETKIGTFTIDVAGNYVIKHVSGKTYTLTPDKFAIFKDKEQLAISKANVIFTQKTKGIMPEILDYYYNKRQDIRKELKGLKQQYTNDKTNKKLKLQIDGFEAKQLCIKLFINSIYGFFGNKNAPFGDDDIASSITLTGQAVIKHSNDLLKKYTKQHIPDISDDLLSQLVIYNDTDSSYISIKPFFNTDDEFAINGKLTDKALKQAADIEAYLNKEIKVFGAEELGSKDCRFLFKREVIADAGIFLQKKRYVIRVMDDEGISTNKFKYVGVEVARSTMPKSIKPYAKKIIEEMISSRSELKTNAIVNEVYEIFAGLKPEEIAFAVGVSNLEKYTVKAKGFTCGKGTPYHVKAAHHYNLLLDELGVADKYEKIVSGDKIRLFYVQKPNKFGLSAIAYKTYYPSEFLQDLKPDYQLMFQKHIFSIVERFYENVQWTAADPGKLTQVNFLDLFKD